MSDPNEAPAEEVARLTLEFHGNGLAPDVLDAIYAKISNLARSHFAENGISASFVGIWNTGCSGITAQKSQPGGEFEPMTFHIVDGEAPAYWATVAPGQTVPFQGLLTDLMFPWCNSWAEMQKKAFRIYNASNGQLLGYVYQHYVSSMVEYIDAWVPEPPGGRINGNTVIGRPASYLGITIGLRGTGELYITGEGTPPLGPIGGFNQPRRP